ncbi:MAG: glycosyltransferase family 2 protein, partial [Clostridia bacterium]|nr:glycosyltransferase family 2 protein [Clostridia bacterium]
MSIIIPVYNVEKYLGNCLDSIINQTYSNIEIICVDDCSTDNSLSILHSYAAVDQRIKIIAKEKNEGTLAARKSGVLSASGQYLTFVDDDDYLERDACEKIIELLQNNQADII